MRWVWILLLVVTGSATGYLITRFEGTPPFIQSSLGPVQIGVEHAHDVRVSDDGTGVESVAIWIQSGDQRFDVLETTYPGSLFTGAALPELERSIEVKIEPAELGLPDGPATLHIEATDFSWGGNASQLEVALNIDTRPPRIAVRTGLTYVRRGGAEAVVYRLDEEVKRHGVALGDDFFPGFPHPADPGLLVALYALPHDAPRDTRAEVVAVDRASNKTIVPITLEVIERSFPTDEIRLSESFMRRKAAELGNGNGSSGDALAAYLKLNGDLRRANAAKIREICASSSDEPLWHGAFLQLPGSHVGSRYADRRNYTYAGRMVDRQVHLGYDLASTSHAPVPASNDGVVAYADDLGIYGKTVIVDHGLGLFSLYGHLSEIGVGRGSAVARGDSLGRTGMTGLAGGDHLHFSMLVSGVFVDPLEWFDARWIQDHIQPKLAPPAQARAAP